MDKARTDSLYKRLGKVGLINEVNVLIWNSTTNAARGAYAEGKADGYAQAMKEVGH